MIRHGAGEPLVLLHGVTGSERMWRDVVPLVAGYHDTVALTMLGHRGGTPATAAPVTVGDFVDDVERSLDALGLQQVHLAGNSLGGWVALELARRGRARSVCALSPAGAWDVSAGNHRPGVRRLRRIIALTRATRWTLPVTSHVALIRLIALRDNAVHGNRVRAAALVDSADDLLDCSVADDVLTSSEQLAPLDPLPCPVTLAWSERDRILPMRTLGARARELFPAATWAPLPGVGHVPMFDDPQLVAEAILRSTDARRTR